jgi:nitrate/nitrite-specific signal transduction histidine kinase
MKKKINKISKDLGISYHTLYKYVNKTPEQLSLRDQTLLKLYKAGIRIEPFLFGKSWEE